MKRWEIKRKIIEQKRQNKRNKEKQAIEGGRNEK
jgi:hypothetical protein